MSGSLNLVVLIGRVGRDPEVRFTRSGDVVASVSLATSEKWGKGEQKSERIEWHRVEVWGKPAEFVRDYVTKGSLLNVQGAIRTEEYKDKDGNPKKSTKIKADRVTLLSGKSAGGFDRTGPTQEEPQAEFQASDDDVPF